MAPRLLLTLLALLTGLAAQIGPVEARVRPVASLLVENVGERRLAQASRAPVALARLPEPGLRSARLYAPSAIWTATTAVVPTVRTRIDRARQ